MQLENQVICFPLDGKKNLPLFDIVGSAEYHKKKMQLCKLSLKSSIMGMEGGKHYRHLGAGGQVELLK